MVSPAQLMETALAHHRAGELDRAATLYRVLIESDSGNAEALHLFGAVQHQKGNNGAAIVMMRRSLDIKESPETWYNLGHVLRVEKMFDQAALAWRRTLELQPNHRDAAFNLARLTGDTGTPEAAVMAWRAAAEAAPGFPPIWFNLGNALLRQKKYGEAAEALGRAVELSPVFAEAWANLAVAFRETEKFAEAEVAARRAVELEPERAQWHSNLGTVLHDRHLIDEALACARKAVALDPVGADGWCNLGTILHDLKRTDEAAGAYENGLAIDPENPVLHKNYALTLMMAGHLERGWAEYEWRWKDHSVIQASRSFAAPRWDGRPFPGKTLLIHAEQGLGDSLQFIRYAPLAAEMGGKVVVECQPSLVRLLRSLKGVAQVVGRGDPLPPFDFHCPTISLPHVFGTTLSTIPRDVPYLRPSPEMADHWARRLGGADGRLRVGLCWSGSPRPHMQHANAATERRSILLSQLAPLAEIPGIRWISLQKGEAAGQTSACPFPIEDFMAEAHDFADTAGLAANLDLVVSVDTSVAHLAGALGRPVWLPACVDSCWRWLLDREDSPWYPTMRLFRQETWNDWQGVIGRLAQALQPLVNR